MLTIALGIGASTAIFSVADAVLFRALPYDQSDRLVLVTSELRKRNVTDYLFSHADFMDLRDGTRDTFQDLGAVVTGRSASPQRNGSLEEVRWALVTPNFLRLMGARIVLGRDFVEADGEAPPLAPAAASPLTPRQPRPAGLPIIVSHAYWQRRFGGDPSIVGRGLPGADPGVATIVGVLAPDFELLFAPNANIERQPDHWMPARLVYDDANRNGVSLRAVGRLKAGVTLDRAQSAVDVLAAGLRKKSIVWETADFRIRVNAMQQHLVAEVRPALLVLTGAALLLLCIACANVSNLLLVRTSVREREMAVRRALGGTRWQVVSPVLAEALLLAAAGSLLGIGVAALAVHGLRAAAPANLPRVDAIRLDDAALTFAAVATLGAAVLFSLAPASFACRRGTADVLRAAGRAPDLGHARLRNAVVVVAVALSCVLSVASGLMVRSFAALQRVNPQYDSHGLLTFHLVGSRGGDRPEQRAAFMREIETRLRAMAGVERVTASTPFPLAGGFYATRWGTEQALADPSKLQSADFQTVLPGYFETLRTPLLAGRTFTDADNAAGQNVVIVDDVLAAKGFPNGHAVGQRLIVNRNTLTEIVGVVAHQRATSLSEPGREQIYFTDGFMGHGVVAHWAVRVAGNPAAQAGAVRTALAQFGSRVAVTQLQPMDTLVDRARSKTRFSLALMSVFAVVSALLAAVGLYGLLSSVIRQRTAEIGVRMALGATPARIFTLVVGQGLRLSITGIAIGVIAAVGLTRAMGNMLIGVAATDFATYATTSALFLVIALGASWLPARRAACLDPAAAFREE